MTHKSNIGIDKIIEILNSQDIQQSLKVIQNTNVQLIPLIVELQKQATPVLQTINSVLLTFAEKATPYIEGFLLAQKAGVFDELKRIHNGLIDQGVDLKAYQNLSLEDLFFALKGQPESRFEEILNTKFGASLPTSTPVLAPGLDLKKLELLLHIIFLMLGIYNQIQQANQLSMKPEEIVELATKNAIEIYQQIEQQKQIVLPKILTTPKHENDCPCTNHLASVTPSDQTGEKKSLNGYEEDKVSSKNNEFPSNSPEKQNKEEWV